MKRSLLIFVIAAALLFGAAFIHYLSHRTIEQKPSYWIDPMEPNVHYPGPGKSHMGMELVPVYPEKGNIKEPNTIQISPAMVSTLGVRTAQVIQGTLSQNIETVGYVVPNENKISHIHTYAEGWIRNLVVKVAGELVVHGQLLLQLYSPALISAQQEYLIALESKKQELVKASYHKLLSLNISQIQIDRIKANHKTDELIDIYSTQNGIVAELNVREGMRVTPETDIMSLVDLSNIWIIAQIFEQQADWVKTGQDVKAKLSAFPGRLWKGKVEYVYPELDPTTRTLKVRFIFDNPDNLLKPNMYVDVTLVGSPKSNVLIIPIEALIRSSHGNRVIVAKGEGRFQVKNVVTGIESGESVEILSGLERGEKVVISGQFLIDSEANLKASTQRMENLEGAPKEINP